MPKPRKSSGGMASKGFPNPIDVHVGHAISEADVPLYLVEWDFKWNTRNKTDRERATLALKGAEDRRLTYRGPH